MTQIKTGGVIQTIDVDGRDVEALYTLCAQIGTQPAATVSERGKPCYTIDHILKHDKKSSVFHIKSYSGFKKEPALNEFQNDDHLIVGHTVLSADTIYDGFDFKIIGNVEPTKDDLEGYYNYLKKQNFEQYLSETGKTHETESARANKYTDIAQKLFTEGKLEEARHNYHMAVNLYPDCYTNNNMGRAEMALKDYESAVTYFEEAVALIHDTSFVVDQFHRDLGEAYYYVSRYADAKTSLNHALSIVKSLEDDEVTEIKTILKDIEAYNRTERERISIGDIFIEIDHGNFYTATLNDYYAAEIRTPPFGEFNPDHQYYCIWHVIEMDDDYVHAQVFAGYKDKPNAKDIAKDYLSYAHMPVDYAGYYELKIVGNIAVKPEQMEAYYTYLKFNDYETYLKKTGKNAEEEIAKSMEIYHEGLALQDQERFNAALDRYIDAINVFPLDAVYHDAACWMFMRNKDYESVLNYGSDGLRILDDQEDKDPEIETHLEAAIGYAYYYLRSDQLAHDYFELALKKREHLHETMVSEIESLMKDLG
jgi:tetratricopeptide (TPR) repeat protein